MHRKIRKVPAGWEHPRDSEGSHIPLLDDYSEALRFWEHGNAAWAECPEDDCSYEEWSGKKPDAEDYMPEWSAGEATHFMLYETTTEGTPLSPAFANLEDLAGWLAENKVPVFADATATKQEWMDSLVGGMPIVIFSIYS